MKTIFKKAVPENLIKDESFMTWLASHTKEITSADPTLPKAKTFQLDFPVANVVGDLMQSSIYLVVIEGKIKYLTLTVNDSPIVTIVSKGEDHQSVWAAVAQKLITMVLSVVIKNDVEDQTDYVVKSMDAPIILHAVKNLSKGIKNFKLAMKGQGIEINSKHLAAKLF